MFGSMISNAQCRAARALIRMQQKSLADLSGVGLSTIKDFESGNRVTYDGNIEAIQKALEDSGVEFIDAIERSGINSGEGVKKKISFPRGFVSHTSAVLGADFNK
jgi:transcriptional regulator with XRE-family HTH domain